MKIFELLLCTGSFAHAREKDYKTFYTVQPLRALFGPKTPHFPESNWIERNNQAWIDRNDEAKEKVNAYSGTTCFSFKFRGFQSRIARLFWVNSCFKMPILAEWNDKYPKCYANNSSKWSKVVRKSKTLLGHLPFQYWGRWIRRDKRFFDVTCRIFLPKVGFHRPFSSQHRLVLSNPNERCGVGALDMSYPANKLTYGKLIVDSPMIFVRDPAIQGNFIETPLEDGTLRVNSPTHWGFKYIADNLGLWRGQTLELLKTRIPSI